MNGLLVGGVILEKLTEVNNAEVDAAGGGGGGGGANEID